jgi:hypothetical protein
MSKAKKMNKGVNGFSVNENVSLEEQIAQRAREIWKEGGCCYGNDLADWFRAEREVMEYHHQRQVGLTSRGCAPM